MTNVIEVIEVLMAGTLWYMAPEMHYTGKATKESDVYSFGILVLEVVCGRKPVNLQIQDAEENFLLVQTVGRAYRSGNILSAVDLELLILYLHPA
jgi:serine/threonine protein kinase